MPRETPFYVKIRCRKVAIKCDKKGILEGVEKFNNQKISIFRFSTLLFSVLVKIHSRFGSFH